MDAKGEEEVGERSQVEGWETEGGRAGVRAAEEQGTVDPVPRRRGGRAGGGQERGALLVVGGPRLLSLLRALVPPAGSPSQRRVLQASPVGSQQVQRCHQACPRKPA